MQLTRGNTGFLERFGVDYGYIQPTRVGLDHGIFDAVIPFRQFLDRQGIHNYESQSRGGLLNARRIPTSFVGLDGMYELPEASLYRAEERGDRRIWFPQVRQHFRGGETLLVVWMNDKFWVINASRMAFRDSLPLASLIQNTPVSGLREYLTRIAASYDSESLHSAGHNLLRRAGEVLEPLIPGGLNVIASGGKGKATFTPWIGILDPDEAFTPEDGIYLVWIFKRDLEEVVLTLNQGITALRKREGLKDSLPILRAEAERIRQALGPALHGLDQKVDFGPDRREAGYAAANIASRTYSVAEMPAEEQLREDLQRMLRLYQNAAWAKGNPTDSGDEGTSTGSDQSIQRNLFPKEFKPKDRRDYLVQVQGRTERRRGDRHELLLAQYAELAKKLGHKPSNKRVHPRDLTLQVAGKEWVVEAKVVYNGNASQAARAAMGQLFEYSYFLYDSQSQPGRMALFTEPLGDAFVALFDALDIGAVWKGPDGWDGSNVARQAGLI